MEWLVAVVLGGMGVALIMAGSRNSAPELFASVFDAPGTDTISGGGKVSVPGGSRFDLGAYLREAAKRAKEGKQPAPPGIPGVDRPGIIGGRPDRPKK